MDGQKNGQKDDQRETIIPNHYYVVVHNYHIQPNYHTVRLGFSNFLKQENAFVTMPPTICLLLNGTIPCIQFQDLQMFCSQGFPIATMRKSVKRGITR